MSMVGNSWIHKSKYNEDDDSERGRKDGGNSKKKARSKSRTRSIFGRRPATSAGAAATSTS